MIDIDAMRQADIQDAPRLTCDSIRNLFRIDLNGNVHRKECYLEPLLRRLSPWLLNIRIRTTHGVMVAPLSSGSRPERYTNSLFLSGGPLMARLRYVEKETATADQEKILAQLTQKSGKIANIWKLWSHSPLTLENFMTFYKSLLKGSLDPKLRELAYLKASLINGCAYCAEAHKLGGRRAGLTDEQLEAVNGQYTDSPLFSPVEKLALRYAEELTTTVRTNDNLMAELKKHLSEADIVELNLTVGVANLTNRFNMSFMTDPD
jgi:uncharacterized peroxidase-related enzyme